MPGSVGKLSCCLVFILDLFLEEVGLGCLLNLVSVRRFQYAFEFSAIIFCPLFFLFISIHQVNITFHTTGRSCNNIQLFTHNIIGLSFTNPLYRCLCEACHCVMLCASVFISLTDADSVQGASSDPVQITLQELNCS